MMTCFPERAAFYAQYKKGAGDFPHQQEDTPCVTGTYR